jgi:DME family drug/metabolite transporter
MDAMIGIRSDDPVLAVNRAMDAVTYEPEGRGRRLTANPGPIGYDPPLSTDYPAVGCRAVSERDAPALPDDTAATVARARLLVLAAATLWSTSGFFAKAPYFRGWSGPALAFWRAAFACAVLWPLVRKPQWSWRLIPMTALFVTMNYAYLTSMATGSAANAIWLQMTAPVFVLLVGVFVFHERSVPRDWWQLVFVAAGVGVILFYESRGAALGAVVWGLVSAMSYAGVVLALRHLREFDPAWLAALNHILTAVCLAPFAWSEAPLPSGIQWPLLACFGIFQMGVPYVLFARGLKSIPGHEATALGMIEPLLVPLWVYLAWGEVPAWWTFAGGGLILLGLAVRFWEPRR